MKSLMKRLVGEFEDMRVLIAVSLIVLAAAESQLMLLQATFNWWLQGARDYLPHLGIRGVQGEADLFIVTLAGVLIGVVGMLAGKCIRDPRPLHPQPILIPVPVESRDYYHEK